MDFLSPSALINYLNDFHFIRPWFLTLMPLVTLIWLLLKRLNNTSQWQDHLPKAVIDALQINKSNTTKSSQAAWLIAWVLISISASGPSWLKQAVPVVQNQSATVIILDLSQSMLAKDLTPDRLTLAKYKLIDVLRVDAEQQNSDGQVALIAYSGGAYTVSPLTDDPRTIEALLPALHPNVMPSLGSNVEEAIAQANTLLQDVGIASGQILLFTDGIHKSAFAHIKKTLSKQHSLSILGIGSNEAAPVPLKNGSFMRQSNGEIVLASLNGRELQKLASSLGGKFAQISSNNSDLDLLLNSRFISDSEQQNTASQDNNSFDQWNDMGHWLLILILPIFLIFFRKGLVYSMPFIAFGLMLSPDDSYAASTWDKLWKNSDQIGAELIEKEDYADASETFKNKEWSAIAAYKNGDYTQAIDQLAGKTDANSLYNSANALALNGDLDKAIENYKKVLELDPDHAGAKKNNTIVEQLKKQQEQEQKQQEQSGEQNSEKNDSDDSKQSDSQEGEPQQSESEQNQSEQQNANQQESQEQSESEQQDASEQQSDDAQKQADDKPPEEDVEDKSASSDSEQTDQEDSDTKETLAAESTTPLKDSSKQWLRSIEDDPSGLLRRKFEYQAWQRQQQGQRSRQKKDDSGQQRY